MRVVVDRLELQDRPELLLRLGKAADAVVGDAERLADGGLAGLALLRLLEGDGRLGGMAGREVIAAQTVEVVGLAHGSVSPTARDVVCQWPNVQAGQSESERRLAAPRRRLTMPRRRRRPRRIARSSWRARRWAAPDSSGGPKRARVTSRTNGSASSE